MLVLRTSAWRSSASPFFFFNDTATTEIYTLSLHDALPICYRAPLIGTNLNRCFGDEFGGGRCLRLVLSLRLSRRQILRSEEHTSELQSQSNLVCRLLLEKKNTRTTA